MKIEDLEMNFPKLKILKIRETIKTFNLLFIRALTSESHKMKHLCEFSTILLFIEGTVFYWKLDRF